MALFRQNHFHYFALRPPLLAAYCVGVDIHGDAAVDEHHSFQIKVGGVLAHIGEDDYDLPFGVRSAMKQLIREQ